jgi:Flp pilus assembly pilin Flp
MPFALWKLYFGIRNLARQEEGQDLVEYSLVLALIATGAFFAVGGLSGRVVSMYNYINTNYP